MNLAGSIPCQIKWLGSKLKPNSGRLSSAASARSAVWMSKAISVGCTSRRELHVALGEHVEDRVKPLGQQRKPGVDHRRRDGRERVEQGQMLEPVKPLTTCNAQLLRRPGGVFQLFGGPRADARRIAVAPHVPRENGLVPRDQPRSNMAWPTRWLLSENICRPCLASV